MPRDVLRCQGLCWLLRRCIHHYASWSLRAKMPMTINSLGAMSKIWGQNAPMPPLFSSPFVKPCILIFISSVPVHVAVQYSSVFEACKSQVGQYEDQNIHPTWMAHNWSLLSAMYCTHVVSTKALTLSLPRVIYFKFLLQPHQKYYITQYEEFGFS